MFRNVFAKILAYSGLFWVLGACSPGEQGFVSHSGEEISEGARGNSPNLAGEAPAAEEPPPPVPLPAPTAAPEPTPSAGPVSQPPAQPSRPGGRQVQWPVEASLGSLQPAGDLVATGGYTVVQSVDVTLPLQKVYAMAPLEYTTPNGTEMSFDPLARILPLEGTGSLRFVRGSPLLPQAERFVEVRFQVRFPSRFAYNPATGYWGNFFPTDWVRFKLLACSAQGRCNVLVEEIPAQTLPGSCVSPETGCERHYQIRHDLSDFADHYKVLVEGTNAADYEDSNGNARLCTHSTRDCFYSHPFCVAGLCAAVARGGDYYQVATPEALIRN
ncbi:MAG: hypothetical protein IT572_02400 [Deltaproteobacteria bacterium]|nr:hypothetical protein [Deltaproteobacteria bacterium]